MKNENHFYALRGKSDRRRKRDSISQKQKELIELYKKEQKLNNIYRNLGLEELEHPYQKGFKRTFVLRDDIAKSKKADFYTELLKYVNTIQYSQRKDFKKKGRKFGRRIYKEREQDLERFYEHEFWKVPEKFRPHFIKKEYYFIHRKSVWTMNVLAEPWRYVLKVTPHMITHRRKTDAVLESERAQLSNYIERKFLRIKMNKAASRSSKWRTWDEPERNKLTPVYKLLKQENEQH